MNKLRLVIALAMTLSTSVRAVEVKPLYENNFEKSALDKVPEEFLVLDGGFAMKEEGGNRFIELPGAPLGEGSGLLFGPTESSGLAVSARIQGTAKGRRLPAFGVGLNGVGGFRLQVSAAKKLIELYKGDDVVASAPFTWESDSWTILQLQIRKVKEGEWKVEGKAWKQGAAEPTSWAIVSDEKSEPVAGRASLWGSPFSGTPIRFDDLAVRRASAP